MSDVSVTNVVIKISGATISQDISKKMRTVSVESSLAYPDSARIVFNDDNVDLIEKCMDTFEPGSTLEVAFPDENDGSVTVFKGEITTLIPHFEESNIASLIVQGYDRSHRLMRGTNTRAFIQMTDSDIVNKIAGEAGLSANVDATSTVHEHIYQENQTNFDFLQQLAQRNGYRVYMDDKKLHYVKSSTTRGSVTVSWDKTLISFRPRLSAARQVNEVIVRGWDNTSQNKIEGRATTSRTHPQIGISNSGGDVSSVFGDAKRIEVNHPVISQQDADNVAQAILDQINSEFVEAEGLMVGNPAVVAGVKLTVENIGSKFSGDYVVTTASHYLTEGGYKTEVRVEGTSPYFLGGIFDQPVNRSNGKHIWAGVYPAVVTNNKDENKENRVKVVYPWLDENEESYWARMILPGAGRQMGSHWLPEIDDEVLVMFEQGDINRPYVIGGVYSAVNKPPEGSQDGEPIDKRIWQSRSGHKFTMDDTSGGEYIELITSAGNILKLDDAAKKIELKTSGGQQLIIDEQGNKITISGANDIEVKGNTAVKVEATNVEVKASASAKIEGTQVEVKGSGMVKVSGGMIQIG